jgi:hypothetical protein
MTLLSRLIGCLGVAVLAASCSRPDRNYEILESKNIQCPTGSTLRYLPWGESGLQAICIVAHGPTMIAEYGHIQIEGQNDMGKKVGEWRWFDDAGKVVHTEHYNGTKR